MDSRIVAFMVSGFALLAFCILFGERVWRYRQGLDERIATAGRLILIDLLLIAAAFEATADSIHDLLGGPPSDAWHILAIGIRSVLAVGGVTLLLTFRDVRYRRDRRPTSAR